MLAAAGICTLLSMAAAYFISRGLTRNIKHLKDIMERTGAGNLELRYQGRSRDAVSYTHLDVYKRQVLASIKIIHLKVWLQTTC